MHRLPKAMPGFGGASGTITALVCRSGPIFVQPVMKGFDYALALRRCQSGTCGCVTSTPPLRHLTHIPSFRGSLNPKP